MGLTLKQNRKIKTPDFIIASTQIRTNTFQNRTSNRQDKKKAFLFDPVIIQVGLRPPAVHILNFSGQGLDGLRFCQLPGEGGTGLVYIAKVEYKNTMLKNLTKRPKNPWFTRHRRLDHAGTSPNPGFFDNSSIIMMGNEVYTKKVILKE
jgi:hypothetical protein